MSKYDKYVFVPSFSLQPCKLVSYNSIFIKNYENGTLEPIAGKKASNRIKKGDTTTGNGITRSHHNFSISDNAYRSLKNRINWLYYLAKSKSIKTYNGKSIFNFKIGFITLTLPSKQKHSTAYITKNLLNNFLTEIRQRTKMENYVWRLEFQKNGNVHYHIVTDTYLDYFLIKSVWNRILKLNGYIDDYQAKFKDLSLSQYHAFRTINGANDFKKNAQLYAKNKSEKWEQPPSVDVKSVISNQAIANYISKYFAKSSDDNPIKNELDTDENSENLRLWFCSRSLSKLKTVSDFCEAVKYDIFAVVSYCKEVRKKAHRYATVLYFEFKNFPPNARRFIEKILRTHAWDKGYRPAT